jgi:cytochrome c biogenesis protein CcdA
MIVYAYVYILGILSILSACTVIVLPVLLSQIMTKRKKLYTALMFSLGFGLSFAVLGAITGLVGQAVVPNYEPYFLGVSAVITFVMALKFFKIISFRMPSLSIKFFPKNTFLLGFVFGFVALSCISALLSAVFVFAISQKSVLLSIITFLVYSMGYSTPLIAASTIMEGEKIASFMVTHRDKVDFTSGILLLFASSYLTLLYFGVILFA